MLFTKMIVAMLIGIAVSVFCFFQVGCTEVWHMFIAVPLGVLCGGLCFEPAEIKAEFAKRKESIIVALKKAGNCILEGIIIILNVVFWAVFIPISIWKANGWEFGDGGVFILSISVVVFFVLGVFSIHVSLVDDNGQISIYKVIPSTTLWFKRWERICDSMFNNESYVKQKFYITFLSVPLFLIYSIIGTISSVVDLISLLCFVIVKRKRVYVMFSIAIGSIYACVCGNMTESLAKAMLAGSIAGSVCLALIFAFAKLDEFLKNNIEILYSKGKI